MSQNHKKIQRTILETLFIIFLFYSNLLMGEFNRSGPGQKNGILWVINDIFTLSNFMIAIITATVIHLAFAYLRDKL